MRITTFLLLLIALSIGPGYPATAFAAQAAQRPLLPGKGSVKRPLPITADALAPALFASPEQSYGPVGDFNGNGSSDLFAVTRKGKRLLWQISDGGRAPFQTINAQPAKPSTLRFADFDGNGIVDVFHLNARGEWFVAPDGRGRLQSLGKRGLTIDALGFGDFNGDGYSDILTIDSRGNWRLLSAARGQWKTLGRFGGAISDLGFGDFDGDGQTDALRIDAKGNWLLLRLQSRQWSPINRLGGSISAMHIADIDGDGKSDVAAWQKGQWLFAAGARGKWRRLSPGPVAVPQSRVGDFDGDGRADLFFEQAKGSERRWWYQDNFRSRAALLRTIVNASDPPAASDDHDDGSADTADHSDVSGGSQSGQHGNSTPPTASATTPVFQAGLRLTEAPGRCYLEARHINHCVLANGHSAAAVAAHINRLQNHSTISCCSALARAAQTAGNSRCNLIEASLQAQLGCPSP